VNYEVERWLVKPEAERDIPRQPCCFPLEPVIQHMHARLDQPISLQELAEDAGWSPFHFHRQFRAATGIPPHEFLTTLRLQEAKRLLLTTPSSVIEVCFAVGYSSLGTFTARFTHLVGVAPGRLRQFANTVSMPTVDRVGELRAAQRGVQRAAGGVYGEVHAQSGMMGPIFVGLFPKPIPQARPIRGDVLATPGTFCIEAPPDGRYYLLAAALPWAMDPRVPLLPGVGLLVGTCAEPLQIRSGRTEQVAHITLRSPRPTDPPVLCCLPFLLNQQFASSATA